MKKLLVLPLLLNAALLAGRFWQEFPVNAQEGEDDLACKEDRTLHSIDSNDDDIVDMSDAVHLLQWLFQGGPEPQVCLAQTTLEARVEALEAVLTYEKQEILSDMSIVHLPMGQDEEGDEICDNDKDDDGDGDVDCADADCSGRPICKGVLFPTAKTIRFTGVNVQIVSGLGATNGNPDNPGSLGRGGAEPPLASQTDTIKQSATS